MKSFETRATSDSRAAVGRNTASRDGHLCAVAVGKTLVKPGARPGRGGKADSTAVNGEVVARTARELVLDAGDLVLLVQPTVGR